ncbi:MAG: GTP--adenosylcobinamide-phosphate guanylyltransferase [Thermoplasmata archaeon]|jgi:adenosylcobinamide-phosphate guanylyltransferase|nr:GTP--adenosylcobinamide-phosphate guanylyltransferase [Thermoplasmata archaeon]
MEALVHAGGKGTRMGRCGIEKPMMKVGDKCAVERVIEALNASKKIERVLVSVSDNTLETEKYLNSIGVETVRTSGDDFMGDLHQALECMNGEYVLTTPSDLPLITTEIFDAIIDYFVPGMMDSLLAVIDERTVRGLGITPSYTRESRGNSWVLSGVSIINRKKTLNGDYLEEVLFETNWPELSVNVNTQRELTLARSFFKE